MWLTCACPCPQLHHLPCPQPRYSFYPFLPLRVVGTGFLSPNVFSNGYGDDMTSDTTCKIVTAPEVE